ncbi:hypothetical protein F5Y05DRAFT_126815 [Hypoxylon sp. FL0543]|nr:hypothetical protein F5Y05DRAFT_126815 [Hypoxylon sp. FL0543]
MSTESIDTSELEGGLFAYGGGSVIACAIVFIVLCTTFVALRFVSHRIVRRPISLEDWLIIPAWVIMMGFCANIICTVKYGDVGRHIAFVLAYEPEAFVAWAKTLFVVEVFYGVLFPLEKTSILLLYLRLFHVHRWFRFTTLVLIAYIWLWGISELLVAIFQCKPIRYQWDKSIEGHCIDQLSYYRWVSVPNIIHDIAMLVLPAPVVWKLQVRLRQKLALSCVFLIGSIGCVASFIRLSIFFRKNALVDNTWASIELMSWTLAETGVILICACLPALWPLFLRVVSGVGTLRSKTGKSTALSGTGESKQYGGLGPRSGHSRGLQATDDDFIPLNDIEDGMGLTYGVASSTAPSEIRNHDTGIHVTTEWEVTGSRSTLQGGK